MARDAVSEVRERTDIVELIGRYVRSKKRAGASRGFARFTARKRPHSSSSPIRRTSIASAAASGGDAFSFLMGVENLEFKDALTELAKRAGVQVTPSAPVNPESRRPSQAFAGTQ